MFILMIAVNVALGGGKKSKDCQEEKGNCLYLWCHDYVCRKPQGLCICTKN